MYSVEWKSKNKSQILTVAGILNIVPSNQILMSILNPKPSGILLNYCFALKERGKKVRKILFSSQRFLKD